MDKESLDDWLQEFIRCDYERIFERFFKEAKPMIKETIMARGPERARPFQETPHVRVLVYQGQFGRSFDGKAVSIFDLKERKGNYQGEVVLNVADIDSSRSLSVYHRSRYGKFIGVRQKNRDLWPGFKFDYIPEQGILVGESLYGYVRSLVELSERCDVGVSTKPWSYYPHEGVNQGRICLPSAHIYFRMKRGSGDAAQISKTEEVYLAGKDIFGEAFSINESERPVDELDI